MRTSPLLRALLVPSLVLAAAAAGLVDDELVLADSKREPAAALVAGTIGRPRTTSPPAVMSP